MTDDQARNVQQYEYDSFGNQHDMKNRIKQPYGYTGREHDRETGLRYYRARYYDGEVGVFLSKDPIGFNSGQFNLYSYVGNDPVNWIDPYGLARGDWWDPLTYGASNVTGGVSAFGFDFNMFNYDDNGVEWDLNMGISTTLFGAGIQINKDLICPNGYEEDSELYVSYSGPSILSKYFGVSMTPDLRHGSLNIGAGIGLPVVNFSGSLESATKAVANKLDGWTNKTVNFFKNRF